jgi:hypothetical protein
VHRQPLRDQQSYRHEAFIWRDPSDFAENLAAFADEGLANGEPVMAALVQEHADWLRGRLGARSASVTFVDMTQLGRNPALIAAAWREFLNRHRGWDRPIRGIGEPIWPGRRPEEVQECQLHEALLNVAFEPETPFWLICPYEAQLGPSVLSEAERSHPAILQDQHYRGSTSYGGQSEVDRLFGADLAPIPAEPRTYAFTVEDVRDVFAMVVREAYAADLSSDQALDLATAARRLASDTLHRGGHGGVVRIWNRPEAVIFEVSDTTVIIDVLAGRGVAPGEHDHGLWSANRNCDLVQVRSNDAGSTVRVYAWK